MTPAALEKTIRRLSDAQTKTARQIGGLKTQGKAMRAQIMNIKFQVLLLLVMVIFHFLTLIIGWFFYA